MRPNQSELGTDGTKVAEATGALALAPTRWLLVSDDVVCADWIASELRRSGSVVRLMDAGGLELSRLGAYDAQVLLACQGPDLRFLRERLRTHPGLRWAVPLFVHYPDPWQDGGGSWIQQLQEAATHLLSADRELELLSRKPPRSFPAPVDRIGPVRVLRALCSAEDVFRVRFASAQHHASVDIAGSLVLGAMFERGGEPPLVGAEALAGVLELSDGIATVEHRPSLNAPMLSLSIDRALERAYAEVRERRLNRDAESPTLRIRSPRLSQPDPERTSSPEDLQNVAPAMTSESSADTKLVELNPLLLQYTPAPMPASAQEPAATGVMSSLAPDTVLSRTLADTHEIQMPRAPLARAYVRLAVLSVLLSLATFAVARVLGFPRSTQGARTENKVRSVHTATQSAAPATGSERAEAPGTSAAPVPAGDALAPLSMRPAPVDNSQQEPQHDAAAVRENTVSSAGGNGPELLLAAQRALKAGDTATALRLAEQAVALRPRRVTYLVVYGDALAAAGRSAAALEQYRAALERQPRSRALQRRIDALAPSAEPQEPTQDALR